jgi:predicted NBD/HSP70 family sugar kinase
MTKRSRATGSNNTDILEMNRSLIVKILKQRGVCSRSELARETGLTQAAITKIVAALIDIGIISETGLIKSTGNRRSFGLQLNAGKYQVIGVKFCRKSFSVGVFDISGKEYAEETTLFDQQSKPHSILDAMKMQIKKYLEKYEHIVAIGIALPGPYLRHEGKIAVITELPNWKKINFKTEFLQAFDKPVFIEHDANSGALAEWWFGGYGLDAHTLVYLLAGEGIGAGIITDDKLIVGAQGANGEIGHISVDVNGPRCECGNYGCLELYCSAISLLKRAEVVAAEHPESLLAKATITYDMIFSSAKAGDKLSIGLVTDAALYIGYGVVTLINAYNPDIIVIGDIMTLGGELVLDTVKSVVKERVIPELQNHTEIKLSNFSIDPILYGAAALATDEVIKLPSAFN